MKPLLFLLPVVALTLALLPAEVALELVFAVVTAVSPVALLTLMPERGMNTPSNRRRARPACSPNACAQAKRPLQSRIAVRIVRFEARGE